MEVKNNFEKATFGAGCFWQIEEVFRKVDGVVSTIVGYMGGKIKNPSYELVCEGNTGYIEVVQLVYDKKIISYNQLLEIFWKIHDPTSHNKQGLNVGEQYKSIIFYHNKKQKNDAEKSLEEKNKKGRYDGRIVTEIRKAEKFYPAEEYHQKYIKKNSNIQTK
ncbi:MAG: peptide-methionine (S)-S-oxide reductase MsrA [Candidatus Thermoplasmatota archaeon]